jgi:hypothetical protein
MKASIWTLLSVVGLIFFFGAGLYVCVFSTHLIPDISSVEMAGTSVSRNPAAIRRTYDFSMLEGSALETAAKNRLLSGLKLIKGQSQIGVELGHFVIKGPGGEKTFACQKFSKIMMTFDGDGTAVNGELPRMEVEGSCEISADINSISPLMIPVARILGEPVGDGEFNFREGNSISVRFANVVEQWPVTWQLKGVRLFNEQDSNDQVIISAEEMKNYFSKPFILQFQQ